MSARTPSGITPQSLFSPVESNPAADKVMGAVPVNTIKNGGGGESNLNDIADFDI